MTLHALRHFSPPSLPTILLLGLIIPIGLVLSYSINEWQHEEQNARRMSVAASDISEKIGAIRALMASLVGQQQSTPAARNASLQVFHEQISEHADYITSIGRYNHIHHADRSSFETRQSELGSRDFLIKGLDENGNTTELNEASWYYPISVLEPRQSDNAALLGSDLRSLDGLERALDKIAEKNQTLLSSFPQSWPSGGQLVLFKPVYHGNEVPSSDAERRRQSDGGYWITVNIDTLLASVIGKMTDYDVTTLVENEHGTTALLHQQAIHTETLHLRALYPRQQFSEQWRIDSSSLIIRFARDTGFTTTALLIHLSILASLSLSLMLLFAYREAQRKREVERQRSSQALYEVREMAERTLNAVQDAIVTLDADLAILHINPAAVVLFNLKPSRTLGQSINEVAEFRLVDGPGTLLNLKAALHQLTDSSKREFDVVPVASSHADLALKLTVSSSTNLAGEISGYVLVMRDISHEHRLTAKLAYQANHDALTGCYNRHYFEQMLSGLIDKMSFSNTSHALCYMDLDQFKIVNDTCGHRAGDRLLTELTEQLRSIIREEDILSRLGGDEFGLILCNVTRDQMTALSNRVFTLFQGFIFRHEDKAFAVRASIGVVFMDNDCQNLNDVMAAADIACYAAKDAGRNSLYVYSADDDALTERSAELNWLPRLQNALQNEEFVLHMQPIASIDKPFRPSTDVQQFPVQHFEFLLRLRNHDGSEFTPWQFIRAAERYDLMRQIDRWVISNACRTVARFAAAGCHHCSFSINLSGQSAADPTLADFIREQFDKYKPDPERIWFELTETAAISHFANATDLFKCIHELGSLIALDDFGSGLSSFGYLKHMPIDIIKIDGQFVRDIDTNKFDRHMVLAIHQLSETMGMKTVAEFVENQAILDELISIGIHYAQGYHIGKPEPAEAALERMNRARPAA